MKTALELNAMTTHGNMNRENKKMNEAIMYVDNTLSFALEEVAKKGRFKVWIKKPEKIKWKYAQAYLEQHDFIVYNFFGYSLISW